MNRYSPYNKFYKTQPKQGFVNARTGLPCATGGNVSLADIVVKLDAMEDALNDILDILDADRTEGMCRAVYVFYWMVFITSLTRTLDADTEEEDDTDEETMAPPPSQSAS